MLRDFLDSGASDVTLGALEQWCRDNDCGDFWDRFVAGKEIPDLDALLERARELPHFFEFTARD